MLRLRLSLIVLLGLMGYRTQVYGQELKYKIDAVFQYPESHIDGTLELEYRNTSTDTLHEIWMFTRANAFRNDRTYYSDHRLAFGDTRFYFSDESAKSYTNRLAFRVNGKLVQITDHPVHQELIRLNLPDPLAPGEACQITTPFFTKIAEPDDPNKWGYAIQMWYPGPAFYGPSGWDLAPEYYTGERLTPVASFAAKLAIPERFQIAVPNARVNDPEFYRTGPFNEAPKKATSKQASGSGNSRSGTMPLRTVQISSEAAPELNIWLLRNYQVDSLVIHPSEGSYAGLTLYHFEPANKLKKSASAAFRREKYRQYIQSLEAAFGSFKGNSISIIEWPDPVRQLTSFYGGARIPVDTGQVNQEQIWARALAGAYFRSSIRVNEPQAPWIYPGWEAYAVNQILKPSQQAAPRLNFWNARLPLDLPRYNWNRRLQEHALQSSRLPIDSLRGPSYLISTEYRPAAWWQQIASVAGKDALNAFFRNISDRYQFSVMNEADLMQELRQAFPDQIKDTALLQDVNWFPKAVSKRPFKWVSFFSLRETDRYRYLSAAPAIGYNKYDGVMLGALLHNYSVPAERFQYLLAPVYGTASGKPGGLGRFEYRINHPSRHASLVASLALASFNGDQFTDSANQTTRQRFSKLVPGLRYQFAAAYPGATLKRYLQWKTFLIREQTLSFTRDTVLQADIIRFPAVNRYVNQLQMVWENQRVLYPYRAEIRAEQGSQFIRLGFTGNYFFNYARGGGMQVRLFAGKFFYLGQKTFLKSFETDAYHLNMSGPRGYEDYTYENYFTGRSEFQGWMSQQIMQRDGFFKVRTDLLSDKVGKSDNWLAAANFSTDIPRKFNPLAVLPIRIPLKLFADVGTYAEAWQKNASTGRFIFDAGIQLSLFHETVQVYVPLLYSKVYRDYFNSTLPDKKLLRTISFSIDIQQFRLHSIRPDLF